VARSPTANSTFRCTQTRKSANQKRASGAGSKDLATATGEGICFRHMRAWQSSSPCHGGVSACMCWTLRLILDLGCTQILCGPGSIIILGKLTSSSDSPARSCPGKQTCLSILTFEVLESAARTPHWQRSKAGLQVQQLL